MVKITDQLLPKESEVLWKDIWWMKIIVLFLMFVSWCIIYKVLAGIFKVLNGKRRSVFENYGLLSPSFPVAPSSNTTAVSENIEITQRKQSCQQLNCLVDSNGFLQTNSNKLKSDDDSVEFYDLGHHGIKYYNDNLSPSSRQHRQRMHSTMSSTSVARRRPCQWPVVNPPAFPKLNELQEDALFDGGNKPNVDRHLCFGDNQAAQPISKRTHGHLSTVFEEDLPDLAVNFEVFNCKRKDHVNQLTKCNNKSTHSQKGYTETNNDNGKDFKVCSDCENLGDNRKDLCTSTMNLAMPSFPCSDKYCTNIPYPVNLECSLCKSKIHCLCKKCSLLSEGGAIKEFNNGCENTIGDNAQDDFLDNYEEEFIDDNFEDMESIVSDEFAGEVAKEMIS